MNPNNFPSSIYQYRQNQMEVSSQENQTQFSGELTGSYAMSALSGFDNVRQDEDFTLSRNHEGRNNNSNVSRRQEEDDR